MSIDLGMPRRLSGHLGISRGQIDGSNCVLCEGEVFRPERSLVLVVVPGYGARYGSRVPWVVRPWGVGGLQGRLTKKKVFRLFYAGVNL